MRGIQTPVRNVRRRIFKEIAKFGYEQRNLQDLEDQPYDIIPGEVAKYRDSIYRERAIVGERLRLAMGMSLNPADKPTRITKGKGIYCRRAVPGMHGTSVYGSLSEEGN